MARASSGDNGALAWATACCVSARGTAGAVAATASAPKACLRLTVICILLFAFLCSGVRNAAFRVGLNGHSAAPLGDFGSVADKANVAPFPGGVHRDIPSFGTGGLSTVHVR